VAFWQFRPYVPVGERLRRARDELDRIQKRTGRKAQPVQVEGRRIVTTFWGEAWCENLARYSDFASRLPRGRTYVRNGSILDLRVEPGRVTARVAGHELYEVEVRLDRLAAARWKGLIADCAGRIGSVIALLRGEVSPDVLQVLTCPGKGLFPDPREISLRCSCPDWADMCKHVAATLYGVGARLDAQPELFFVLRQVDKEELVAAAAQADLVGKGQAASGRKRLAAGALGAVFGIDLDEGGPARPGKSRRAAAVAARRPRR